MQIKSLSVTEVNNYIKRTIDNDFILNNLRVQGEISNLKFHSSGHIYFSLKDEDSKINCIMFKYNAENLSIPLEEGKKVEIRGKASVYLKDGTYQLYCSSISEIGLGELFIRFNKLKERLEAQGLFKDEHKKKLPKYPFKIGVVTSPTGAAIKDIIQVTERRNPFTELIVYPALVQGKNSSASLIKGLKALDERGDIDIIILTRGGGSIEELWSFNDEELAYSIYKTRCPVISGVGHERDFTISDFVADIRAATPSQAAEIAVPEIGNIQGELERLIDRLNLILENKIVREKNDLELYKRRLENFNTISYIVHKFNEIDGLADNLNKLIKIKLDNGYQELSSKKQLLEAHNPLNVLNKGYTLVYQNDELIKSKSNFKEAALTRIIFQDGEAMGFFNGIKKEKI